MTITNPLTHSPARIDFIDILRGMAVLGITITNVLSQAQSTVYWKNMNLNQSLTGLNYYSWIMEMGIFEGPMRGLLSLIFGASFLLFMQRFDKQSSTVKNPAVIYYKRLFWMFMFGLLNAYVFLWPGDILCAYAVFALVLYPIRKLSPRVLITAAGLMLLYGVYHETALLYEKKDFIVRGDQVELMQQEGNTLTRDQQKTLAAWHQFQKENSQEKIENDVRKEIYFVNHASYPELVSFCWNYERDYPVTGYYAWWDILPFFLIGMALLKTGFITGRSATGMYIILAITGITAALVIVYYDLNLRYTSRFDAIRIIRGSFIDLYQFRRLAQTIGYLSMLILLYKVIPLRRLFNIFIPLGKMSLTTYLLQGLITPSVFLAFGWYGQLERYQIYEVLVFIWIFQIFFNMVWLRYFRTGPFEWLLHSLTWSKVQPFKKQGLQMKDYK